MPINDQIIFSARNRLGCCEGNSAVFATCHYLEKYKRNRETIEKKNAWETDEIFTGEPLSSAGPNPTQAKEKDLKEIFLSGNLINAEQALKENRAKGDAFHGIAPRSWELTRQEKDGRLICIKKGVIDFDLTENGEIVYSNGKYLIQMDRQGKEQVIEKVDLINRVRVRC